jgi:hypothetical protein
MKVKSCLMRKEPDSMNRSTRLLFLMLALALLLSGCSGGVPGPKPDLRGSNPLLVSATGRVFFVSATGGDDLNDGLSPEKPWKTLAKASDMIYAAGDVIALLAGDVWSAETFFGKGSGSEGKPIVLTYYGTGKRPELRIGDSTKGIGIRLYEASYWRVDNLHLSGGKLGIYLNYYTVGLRRAGTGSTRR